jgi:ribonuclease-3
VVALTDSRTSLEERLGFAPQSALFARAVTHSSFSGEHDVESNERLEFLGDAVVNLAIADAILRDYPQLNEGSGSLARSRVVNEEALANVAKEIGVPEVLILGKGEAKSGGASRPSLLADAFEALIGALYLERGPDFAVRTAQELLADTLAEAARSPLVSDAKSQLRQWAEAQGFGPPVYDVTVTGPDHDPTFHVRVTVEHAVVGEATGRSKKAAEIAAALAAWEGRRNA